MYAAKPTKQQLIWHDLELGVLIHFLEDVYGNVPLNEVDPPNLNPEQWVRCAWEMGAKYAILTTKHGTGFCAWPTKEHPFSVSAMKWKDGKGDVVREFIDACHKYGLKPGLYYHTKRYDYYNVNNAVQYDLKSEWYQEYVRHVEAQLKELFTEYGELFEVWFDGAVFPVEDGGPDVLALLEKYQPNAVVFQGPKSHKHNLRWVGNERGLAPENCWATTNAGDAGYDGTVEEDMAGEGDQNGKYYWPAETDMPNRSSKAQGGGWGWKPDQTEFAFSTEHLIDCYIRSVGRNSNLLLGMAISANGDFEDEEQFIAFGNAIKDTFGTPIAITENPVTVNGTDVELEIPDGKSFDYIVVRENIENGQMIRGFEILLDGEKVYNSCCLGHKRIIPMKNTAAKKVIFRVTNAAGDWKLRDIAVY